MSPEYTHLIAALQSMRDRMMAALPAKFGDAFDGDFDTMLEAANALKRAATLRQQAARVDEASIREVISDLREWGEAGDEQLLVRANRLEAALSAQPAERQVEPIDPAASWPEDTGTENGDYECVCASCGRHFIGYKRRVTCRLCHTHPAAPVGVPDGMALDAEDWAVLRRLRRALPDVGLNGWHRGVTVLEKVLAAAPSQRAEVK